MHRPPAHHAPFATDALTGVDATWRIEIIRDALCDDDLPSEFAIVWRIYRIDAATGVYERWFLAHPNPGDARIPSHVIDAARRLRRSVIADQDAAPVMTAPLPPPAGQQLSLL